MPCQIHPHRPSACPCYNLCVQCAASCIEPCRCAERKRKADEEAEKHKKECEKHAIHKEIGPIPVPICVEPTVSVTVNVKEEPVKQEPDPPKSEPKKEPPTPPPTPAAREDNLETYEMIRDRTVSVDSLDKFVEALQRDAAVTRRELEAKIKQEDALIEKLNDTFARKLAELKLQNENLLEEKRKIEERISEKERAADETVAIQEKQEEIKKKIKKIQKQEKRAREAAKWESLSRGKSAVEAVNSPRRGKDH